MEGGEVAGARGEEEGRWRQRHQRMKKRHEEGEREKFTSDDDDDERREKNLPPNCGIFSLARSLAA
jgi:hypothetical protein